MPERYWRVVGWCPRIGAEQRGSGTVYSPWGGRSDYQRKVGVQRDVMWLREVVCIRHLSMGVDTRSELKKDKRHWPNSLSFILSGKEGSAKLI